jgi:hypothetical protein
MRRSAQIAVPTAVALGWLLGACAEKKSFSGGAKTTASKSASAEVEQPTPIPQATHAVVAEPGPTPIPKTTEEVEIFRNCDTVKGIGVVGTLYRLDSSTQRLPDFSKMNPIKDLCIRQFDIANRHFKDGFPGVDNLDEWFGINFNGNLKVDVAGEYEFKLVSDDGSILYLDGMELINNDGTHSAQAISKKVKLTAGTHRINLKYFQGPADEIALELFWTPPNGQEEYVPEARLSHGK